MNRFIYHLDEMLLLLQEKDRKQNTHYHDKHMVCFYLAMQYPDKYCLWDYASFYPTMMLLESRNIPSEVETERYYKSLRGIYQIVKKDTETMALFNYLLASTEIKVIPELFLMNDWMDFVSKQKK